MRFKSEKEMKEYIIKNKNNLTKEDYEDIRKFRKNQKIQQQMKLTEEKSLWNSLKNINPETV